MGSTRRGEAGQLQERAIRRTVWGSGMYVHGRIDPNERFRERRRRARRRKRLRRALVVAVALAAAAGVGLGASFFTRDHSGPPAQAPTRRAAAPALRRPPAEMRGVHVTMALASLPGKLDEYLALRGDGLNTLELDVKDESGQVGFVAADLPPLARTLGAARPYYDPVQVARRAHAAGLYLIGRVVAFQDSRLAAARPDLALRRRDGTPWVDAAGRGWVDPYDRRVWRYVVDVAAAAARAGFDEIQLDYVRFPSDGDIASIVYPPRRPAKGRAIEAFLAYAARRLRPLGVRVSAALFGLAATRDLGIGQVPRWIGRHVDAIYPMVYPSHYVPGEYDLVEPEAFPGATVRRSLERFRRQLRGLRVRLVPWLQDFSLRRPYGREEVAEQVDAARREGAAGFLLWNPDGVYHREALAGP
jgi:hypothetical protein